MGNELQLLVVLGAIRDNENRILVAKRVDASIPAAYGKWEFPGGKVDFGEVPEQALYRELEEETGLKVEMQRLLPKLFTNIWTRSGGQRIQVFLLTYECRIIGGELSNRAVKDEIGELRFASLAELGTWDLLPNVREALKYL